MEPTLTACVPELALGKLNGGVGTRSARVTDINQNHNNQVTLDARAPLLAPSTQPMGKLTLVLDLDNTLICAERGQFMRPGLLPFLENASCEFSLVLYTLGVHKHALRSLALIDPSNKYFQRRIITREQLTAPTKRLDCLCADPKGVLILDDRCDVWHSQLENLLLAPPYWGAGNDRYLSFIWPLLQDLRAEFLSLETSGQLADMRDLLRRKRSHILSGVSLAFANVPPSIDERVTLPQSLVQLAEMYGANICRETQDHPTHLIACEPCQIEACECVVVSVVWLHDAVRFLERKQEVEYPPSRQVASPLSRKRRAAAELKKKSVEPSKHAMNLRSSGNSIPTAEAAFPPV